ncbi:MAG: DUF3500 domain-containing protein [Bryobacterales bacterium]|nr:DUF3500 domain-containing protein [Bryobacterales bacterium]
MCLSLRRRTFLSGIAALFPAHHLCSQTTNADPQLASSIAGAANTFIATLRPELRSQLEFSFEDPERKDWSNVPHFAHPRKGARMGDCNTQERRSAHNLISSILSSQGYGKALAIMERDEFLGENSPTPTAEARAGAVNSSGRFGSEFYFLGVFGKPGSAAPWGVQLDGHHLAVNVTVVDHRVTVTPAFLGAEPAIIPSGRHAGWEVLGGESAKGFALRHSLNAAQARLAVLAETVPQGIFTGPGREDALKTPAGVASLRGSQRDLLESLIEEYLGNIPAGVASEYRKAIQKAGFDSLHFAWMGQAEIGKPAYYRIHSPALLIEYENMLPLNPASGKGANHIHTVLRIPGNDFGHDWLRQHHQEDSHAGGNPDGAHS